MAPPQGSLAQNMEIDRKYNKNVWLQNHLAKMLEIWYVALPSCLWLGLLK